MGNSFIGFPVPRARIADMISGSAPPKIHHTDHETGGGDEVDCTGLTGAGGITFPYDDILFIENFNSIDLIGSSTSGSAVVQASNSLVRLQTGTTVDSYNALYKPAEHPYKVPSFSKKAELRCKVLVDFSTSQTGEMYILRGRGTGFQHFGFWLDDNVLKGSIVGPNGHKSVTLETFAAGAFSATRTLRAVFDPSSGVKFYVDGTLEGELTTLADLPTSTDAAHVYWFIWLHNKAAAEQKELEFSEVLFWQEP